jgi:hypothetical protein
VDGRFLITRRYRDIMIRLTLRGRALASQKPPRGKTIDDPNKIAWPET